MGQGSISYRGATLENCRESFLGSIVDRMEASSGNETESVRATIRHWQDQVNTMPPGSIEIQIDTFIESKAEVDRLIELLELVSGNLSESGMNESAREALRIVNFLQQQN